MAYKHFDADPTAVIDHEAIADMTLIRLNRGMGPLSNLNQTLMNEMTRPGQIDEFAAMLADLASHAFVEDGQPTVAAARSSYLWGTALALEVLDSIAFDRGLPLGDYRVGMVKLDTRVTPSLKLDSEDNDPQRLLFYVGQAVLALGEDNFKQVETPYDSVVETVAAFDADVILSKPFESAFGMTYMKGKMAQVALLEQMHDATAHAAIGTMSNFDKELRGFLST